MKCIRSAPTCGVHGSIGSTTYARIRKRNLEPYQKRTSYTVLGCFAVRRGRSSQVLKAPVELPASRQTPNGLTYANDTTRPRHSGVRSHPSVPGHSGPSPGGSWPDAARCGPRDSSHAAPSRAAQPRQYDRREELSNVLRWILLQSPRAACSDHSSARPLGPALSPDALGRRCPQERPGVPQFPESVLQHR